MVASNSELGDAARLASNMSEEYYEKDGKLYQKGEFSFLDKEVGEFEKSKIG
jgi:hypothetical protein